jgi:hypothetical protein
MVMMVFAPMPLLVDFFAVAMGVNHRQDEDNNPARQQHNHYGLMPPDLADEL